MAGWYHVQEKRPGSSLKLLGGRRRAESAPADSPQHEGLREEHAHLVAAYCGTYPEDAEERIRCTDRLRLHEQPQRSAA
jgi:hypothetical protein